MNTCQSCKAVIDRFSPGQAEYTLRQGPKPLYCSVQCRVWDTPSKHRKGSNLNDQVSKLPELLNQPKGEIQ